MARLGGAWVPPCTRTSLKLLRAPSPMCCRWWEASLRPPWSRTGVLGRLWKAWPNRAEKGYDEAIEGI